MILVTGSTDTNGIEIVRLLSRVGVPCRALVRNPHKAAIFSDLPGVEVVEGDLGRPETLAPGAHRLRQGPSVFVDRTRLGQAARKLRPGGQRSGCALHCEVFRGWAPTFIPNGDSCAGMERRSGNSRTRASHSRIYNRIS